MSKKTNRHSESQSDEESGGHSEESIDVESYKDKLPDDLDVTKYVGPYQFPSPRKRKTAAMFILTIALISIGLGINSSNTSLIVAGIISLVIGALFFLLGWELNAKDLEALTLAASQAPFSVGHASAQLCFTGWASKPTWRVVVFSSDEPPTQRGLVEISAVTKEITSTFFDMEEPETRVKGQPKKKKQGQALQAIDKTEIVEDGNA